MENGFAGKGAEDFVASFQSFSQDPVRPLVWLVVFLLATHFIVVKGVKKGIERSAKILMPMLFILILILAVCSMTLPNAGKGLEFLLKPDFSKVDQDVFLGAMGQAFFSLSLGMGCLSTYASYFGSETKLGKTALSVGAIDTFVAILAGFIIFPAAFSVGIQPDAGPSLIFVTLPNVFINMPGGWIWGTLFFVFMTFASFTTVIAVFQNLMAPWEEAFGWSKKKIALINVVIVFLGSLPCALSFNLFGKLPGVLGELLGGGRILDYEDFIVSNVLLPIGALVYLLFCVTRWGWGYDNYLEECNKGKGWRMPRGLKPYFQFVLPVLIMVIMISGLWSFFAK